MVRLDHVLSPSKIILGTTTAGILNQEGKVLKLILPIVIVVAILTGIITNNCYTVYLREGYNMKDFFSTKIGHQTIAFIVTVVSFPFLLSWRYRAYYRCFDHWNGINAFRYVGCTNDIVCSWKENYKEDVKQEDVKQEVA